MRLPAHGIPKFEGIDDLRRLVQAPERVLDDAEQAHISAVIDQLYEAEAEPSMPFGYRALDLGAALATVDRRGADQARNREQVRAAWNVRFHVDSTDQATIGARIDALLDGPAAVLDSQRGVAELRTLLHLATDDRRLPAALGIPTLDKLDDAIRHNLAGPLERDGTSGAAGADFIGRWKLDRDPARLAAWQSTLDDAAHGRAELPADTTLELLLSPASHFESRSKPQRIRLLDALARAGGGPITTARARTAGRPSWEVHNHPDVLRHLSIQIRRAFRGEAPVPAGIRAQDIIESWHYRRATPAARRSVLEQHARAGTRPIFDEYRVHVFLDPTAMAIGRRQANVAITDAYRSGAPLPEWIEVDDVLLAPVTERQRASLLGAWSGEDWASTPAGAAFQLVAARLRIHGEAMGGGAPGADALRRSTLDMIERNLGRIVGDAHDGYRGHPDYAELGRVRANVETLAGLQAAHAPTAAPAVRAAPGVPLTW